MCQGWVGKGRGLAGSLRQSPGFWKSVGFLSVSFLFSFRDIRPLYYWVGQKVCFSHILAPVVLNCLYCRNYFVRLYWDSCHISMHLKKKLLKTDEFLCSHFNIEDRRNNIFSILCFTISRKVKMLLKCKKRFVQYMEKALWLTECVKSGLQSFLVLLTFWPNNSLLWGCLMHQKMFSSSPGLYPLEANGGRILPYSKYPDQ